VIGHLESHYRARVLLTGGPSDLEADYGDRLAAGSEATNLVGQSSLKQLAALIAASDLVICPDSGPAHMATALGTTVIGLYAGSNPQRTGPYLSQKYTINRYPEAIKLYRVRHPDVMGLIKVEDVVQSMDFFFDDRGF
jgi:heptosyltransferase I